MSETPPPLPISADLLEILRDPKAVQEPAKYGPDPGRLELAHNCWLVSKDTGYKYPIKDGIPVMLIEEGEKWKDTPVDELPVPPETADKPDRAEVGPAPARGAAASPEAEAAPPNVLFFVVGAVAALAIAVGLWRYFAARSA
jgi:uncharacterized protein